MDVAAARERALERLRELEDPESPLSLYDEFGPVEHAWCWLFYFNSAKYIATREYSQMVVSGPVVVNKDGSETWVAPSSPPLERWLNVYAMEHGYPEVAVPEPNAANPFE